MDGTAFEILWLILMLVHYCVTFIPGHHTKCFRCCKSEMEKKQDLSLLQLKQKNIVHLIAHRSILPYAI